MKWLSDLVLPFWVKPLVFVLLLAVGAWECFNAGIAHEHAKNQAEQNAELVKKQQRILELTNINRELERKSAMDAVAIENLYQEQKENAQTKTDHLMRDVRTGNKRLFVNTKPPATADNGGEASGIAAIKLGDDASTRSELSTEDGKFLISFAAEADQVARKLKWCQGMLLIDRNLPVPDLQLAPLSIVNQKE